jgi:hypothetical protein
VTHRFGWRRQYSPAHGLPSHVAPGAPLEVARPEAEPEVQVQPTKSLEDRRESHRVKVCGVAVLRSGGAALLCRIADLSTGGIGLRTEDIAGAARIAVGDPVAIDLQLDPRRAPRVSHEGTVRHLDGGRIGVAFRVVPAALQDPPPMRADDTPPELRVVNGTGAARRAAFRWGRWRT